MSKNAKTLESFVAYCKVHPGERFWQALRNWSGFASVRATLSNGLGFVADYDTFYFEERNPITEKEKD